MNRAVKRWIRLSWAVITVFAVSASAADLPPAPSRALLDQYCLGCHNQKLKTAGVALDAVDLSRIGGQADVLERVLRKLRTGEMPPVGMPRPKPSVAASFTKTLEGALDRASAANPNPGRPVIHRLNRAEYGNAIRDLLALEIDVASLLPADDSGYGFDNIGDVLSFSPTLLERYMTVSRMVSRLAVGDTGIKPAQEEFSVPRETTQAGRVRRNDRVSDDLPFDSRGGLSFRYYFPLDGEYVIKVKVPNTNPASQSPDPLVFELRQSIKAGSRLVGVTFLRVSAKPEQEGPPTGRRTPVSPPVGNGGTPPAELDLRLDGGRLKRFQVPEYGIAPSQVSSVLVSGPYNPTGPGDTPSRARIFVSRPTGDGKEDLDCARTILSTLARRAFRRPVTEADIKPLLAFYQTGRKEGGFEYGIEMALRAMLVSPDFLFRAENDPRGASPGSACRVGDFELASRLSFFLWSSIPDDRLLDLAEQGRLKDPAVLEQQVGRMLDDPRSESLVSNFAGQWLYVRGLAQAKPDPEEFPEFDESLRRAFGRETELFFQAVLRENRSVLELLDAKYTYLNQRLAEHYGIPNLYGSQFRRVDVADPNRGGLLGQGGILTVTSYPNRTSVVQRGKWVLENLLGSPPPPPPPDVPDLKPHKDGKLVTMREQMEFHRTNAVCASCHARMDPIGFALENYNGVGKWRTRDGGSVIDASGKLPDGTTFEAPAGLKKLLLEKYRDDFVSTASAKLLTYALGRGLEYYDMPAVRSITRDVARDDFRMRALIAAVVRSTPFQMRRAPEK
jgi:hypothetical protein